MDTGMMNSDGGEEINTTIVTEQNALFCDFGRALFAVKPMRVALHTPLLTVRGELQ